MREHWDSSWLEGRRGGDGSSVCSALPFKGLWHSTDLCKPVQASEFALGKTEFENAAHHLYNWDSVAFGQSRGIMLPYNLHRLCLRLRQNKREVSKSQDN